MPVRKWKEIQEMLRSCLILFCTLAASAPAAIWPEHLGQYNRKSAGVADTSTDDRAQWDEYGLEVTEYADYGSFKVDASRFRDTTGAYAASLEQQIGHLRVGNYLVLCSGKCPKDIGDLAEKALPNVSNTPVPVLAAYLPAANRIPRSERYILGPIGLRNLAPGVPETLVGFQFSPEGIVARYRTHKGDQLLAIFSYPTPQIARDQAAAFEKAGFGQVKRTGPYVAVVPSPADPVAAESLLSGINYQASVSENEPIRIPIRPQTAARMILAIFTLAGIVLVFCVLSGVAFAGLRIFGKKFGYVNADESMIVLNLRGK